jgi:hypothetical protein
MAQSLFRQEAKANHSFTKEKKIEVLLALENKSVRECEKEILKYSSAAHKPMEKVRPISPELVQVSFSAPREFIEKLEKLKAIRSNRSHQNTKTSTLEILDDLLNQAIEKEDPAREKPERQNSGRTNLGQQNTQFNPRRRVSVAREVKSKVKSENLNSADLNLSEMNSTSLKSTRYVPREIKRKIWQKYGNVTTEKLNLFLAE